MSHEIAIIGSDVTSKATDEIAMSSARLTTALIPDDGNAVQIFESGAKGNELQQVGDHLHVDALTTRRLDEIQQLHVLLERERDVHVVNALTPHDFGGFLEAAKQRQASITEMIAASPVVDETDNLVAQLAMFEHLVSHHPTELACPGDQDPPKADPCNPSPLQCFPHQLARQIAERDVEDEEDAPTPLPM